MTDLVTKRKSRHIGSGEKGTQGYGRVLREIVRVEERLDLIYDTNHKSRR
jgi:hypothetical protein